MKGVILFALAVSLCGNVSLRAQVVTFDPTNLTQSIVNSTKEVIEASTTASNMIKNFQQTVKIYEQTKKYYDALRQVNDLVRNARKVKECILLVGEMSEMYIDGFRTMMDDRNFTTDELSAIAFGYARILEECGFLLDDLEQLTSSSGLQMNDHERISLIDGIYGSMLRYRNLMAYYTRKNISVSYLRSRNTADMERVRALYGSRLDRYR